MENYNKVVEFAQIAQIFNIPDADKKYLQDKISGWDDYESPYVLFDMVLELAGNGEYTLLHNIYLTMYAHVAPGVDFAIEGFEDVILEMTEKNSDCFTFLQDALTREEMYEAYSSDDFIKYYDALVTAKVPSLFLPRLYFERKTHRARFEYEKMWHQFLNHAAPSFEKLSDQLILASPFESYYGNRDGHIYVNVMVPLIRKYYPRSATLHFMWAAIQTLIDYKGQLSSMELDLAEGIMRVWEVYWTNEHAPAPKIEAEKILQQFSGALITNPSFEFRLVYQYLLSSINSGSPEFSIRWAQEMSHAKSTLLSLAHNKSKLAQKALAEFSPPEPDKIDMVQWEGLIVTLDEFINGNTTLEARSAKEFTIDIMSKTRFLPISRVLLSTLLPNIPWTKDLVDIFNLYGHITRTDNRRSRQLMIKCMAPQCAENANYVCENDGPQYFCSQECQKTHYMPK